MLSMSSLDPLLQDLSGMEPFDPTREPPEVTDADLRELAVDIESAIEEWDDYIENRMPDFEDRHSTTASPTSVAEMVRQAGQTNGRP